MQYPRILQLLFFAVVLLGAAWVVTSPGRQAFQNADTVLFALTSTQTWTPYYWGQDRLGMLLPLLAMPITNPFLNLLFQDWLSLAATFLCVWAVAFCFVNAKISIMAGLASVFILVALFPVETLCVFIAQSQYSVALLLGLAGIHALLHRNQAKGPLQRSASAAICITCFTLSLWVNITMVIVILPLILATGIWMLFFRYPQQERQDLKPCHMAVCALGKAALGAALLVAAFLMNRVLVAACNLPATPTDILPPSMWPTAWRAAATLLWQQQGLVYTAILLTVLIVASTIHCACQQRLAVKTILPAMLILLTAAGYFLVVALSIHVFYSSHFRYFIPAVLLVVAGGVTGAGIMLKDHRRNQPLISLSLALAGSTMAALLFRYGIPSIRDSESRLDERWGKPARAIIRNDATHVMGDYWRVWPYVFWSNHLHHKENTADQVYGITYRCGPAAKAWARMPAKDFRIAGIHPITKAYTDWGPIPDLPELHRTRVILEPDLHLYQAIPKPRASPERK